MQLIIASSRPVDTGGWKGWRGPDPPLFSTEKFPFLRKIRVDRKTDKKRHKKKGVQSKKWSPSQNFFHVLCSVTQYFLLIFDETLIISQRAATKTHPRAYQCISDNCINFALNVIIPLFVNKASLKIHVCIKMRFCTSFDINLLFSNFLVY